MTHDINPSTTNPQPDNSPDSSKNKASTKASANLHQQCSDLLAEVDAFQSLLKQNLRNPQLVEARTFRSNVNSELRMLQKLEQRVTTQIQKSKAAAKEDADADSDEEAEEEDEEKQQADIDAEIEMRMVHALSSSNMPFYQAVWDIAKTCEGLLSMGKRFYWGGNERETAVGKGGGDKQANKDKRKSVFVDIVAADGEEWVKVSTISENRLIFEMAKKGWEAASEDEYSDSEGERPTRTVLRNFDGEDPGTDDDDDEMELIKLARDLRKASDAVRVRYRHPRVRLVLPKIGEGNVPEIDDVLAEVRSYGITVECQGQISRRDDTTDLVPLLPQPFKKFTSNLNVDCTLLLAIVSDLSHIDNIPVLPTFHKAIVRQIEVEREMPLLPSELWPAMGSRNLVATQEAATRMREIVELLGTSTEKARMEIFLENPSAPEVDRQTLIQRFQALSDHRVPEDWALPLRVVDPQPDIKHALAEKRLPPVAEEVAKQLSDINHSVFMYGWAKDITTITSNRTIDRQIESTIEKSREDDELVGPNVWVCDTARSLVGKDRDRKD